MKTLSFNQLQICIFFLIFILFTSAVVSYRVFIERPQLEQSILKVVQKELQILSYSAKNYLTSLNAINYDYAVWDQSYHYIDNPQPEYISENFIDDTFVSLKLDGVMIFKENLEVTFTKGYDHQNDKSLNFNFFDFEASPENKGIFPLRTKNKKVAQSSGMIQTKFGPALYSVTEIKRSNRTGKNNGFILFLRLFKPEVIEEIEQYTMTKIAMSPVKDTANRLPIISWANDELLTAITPITERYILDFQKIPLIQLTMRHSSGEFPPLLDKQSFIFISLFTILIFIVYSLISYIIIRPVKLLANQIQNIDENENVKFLDESYQIKELDNVSLHFNELMATIARQKALLSQQVYTDTLTQIANRRGFEQHLEQQCQLFIRQGVGFTVIITDVDHFKLYNDNLGHLAGDEALVKVAQTLNEHFKRSNDLCARYGGEEFIMFYSDFAPESLELKLNQILTSFVDLNLPHPASKTAPHVTVSVGACTVLSTELIEKELSPKDVIRAADHALYQAKKNGRNCFKRINFIEFLDSEN